MSSLPSYAQVAKGVSHDGDANTLTVSTVSSYNYDDSHHPFFGLHFDCLDCFPTLHHATEVSSATENPILGKHWGRVRSIGDDAITRLVARLLLCGQHDEYSVQEQLSGSYNVVYTVFNRRRRDRVCLKVPSTGHKERWMAADAIALRNEALTIQLIKKETMCPVPTIFAFDDTMENEIGAPYILMSFMEGRQLTDMEDFWAEAGVYEERYKNLLHSLAQSMAELSRLRFSQIGVLEFPEGSTQAPAIGDLRDEYILDLNMLPNMDHEDVNTARIWKCYGPFQTSEEYFVSRYQNLPQRQSQDASSESVHKLLELVIFSVPFSGVPDTNAQETFTLAHPDLHAANIFCDEDGNVTGIIDWEGARVLPIYLGFTAVPFSLRDDWTEGYNWPFQDGQLSPKELAQLRNQYATAIREHLQERDDWVYPEKSVMFTALDHALDALYAGNSNVAKQFMNKILHAVLPNIEPDDFYSLLATCDGIEQFLENEAGIYIQRELQELFRCEAETRILCNKGIQPPERPSQNPGSSREPEVET